MSNPKSKFPNLKCIVHYITVYYIYMFITFIIAGCFLSGEDTKKYYAIRSAFVYCK